MITRSGMRIPEYHDVVDDVLKVFGQVRVPFSMLLCIAPSRPSRC
jgi:hypothetical protein